MLLKVGTQVSNALKIRLTKFHQHLSTGSQVFEGWDKQLATRKEFSRLCYRPHREITRCGQKGWKNMKMGKISFTSLPTTHEQG